MATTSSGGPTRGFGINLSDHLGGSWDDSKEFIKEEFEQLKGTIRNQATQSFGFVGQTYPQDPLGTAATGTGAMMGLGVYATPSSTGKLLIILSGSLKQTLSGGGAEIQMRYGKGDAPSNGQQPQGTLLGATAVFHPTSVNNQTVPFSQQGILDNLTNGTRIWFDASVSTNGTGVASIEFLSVTIVEI